MNKLSFFSYSYPAFTLGLRDDSEIDAVPEKFQA